MAKGTFVDELFADPESWARKYTPDFFGPDGRFDFQALRRAVRGRVPQTTARLTHALTIRSGTTGRPIGAIKSFGPQQTRAVDDVFEVDANAEGLPVDVVPQVLTTRTLRISRYDLYTRLMEEAFGTSELVVLTDQFRPFSVREIWRGPSGILTGGIRAYEYLGCWFEDIGRSMDASGDRVVMADGVLRWKKKRKVL